MTDLTEIARGLCSGGLCAATCTNCTRILAALELARKQEREAGVESVTSIRCVRSGHHTRPPYNRNESDGGECGACCYDSGYTAGAMKQTGECVAHCIQAKREGFREGMGRAFEIADALATVENVGVRDAIAKDIKEKAGE